MYEINIIYNITLYEFIHHSTLLWSTLRHLTVCLKCIEACLCTICTHIFVWHVRINFQYGLESGQMQINVHLNKIFDGYFIPFTAVICNSCYDVFVFLSFPIKIIVFVSLKNNNKKKKTYIQGEEPKFTIFFRHLPKSVCKLDWVNRFKQDFKHK